MSGGLSALGMARGYAAGKARVIEINEDRARGEFLRRLDAAPFEVTDWEAQFIEGFLTYDVLPSWRTPARRAAADELRKKYGGRI